MSGAPFGELRRFESIDSTNRYLLEEARAGAPEGLVAVADHQSAGRGRLGRRWESPPGASLLVSVLLRPVLAPEQLYLCTALVALAGADACTAAAAVVPSLKWPNDLLVGDRKLAGVLAESDAGAAGGPPGSVAVVVGIGVNVDWPGPPGAGGTSLSAEAGREVDREEVLAGLRSALGRRRPDLDRPEGRRALAGELRARCATLGRRVRVDLGRRVVVGVARDLTSSGRLLVATGEGEVTVDAGDVVHLRDEAEYPAPPAGPGSPGGAGRPRAVPPPGGAAATR